MYNTENLKYIGEGGQGTVFQIDHKRCVKVYKDTKYLPLEVSNSIKAQKVKNLFPKVYSWKDNYLIREYVEGVDLRHYLKKHRLTKSISEQVVEIIKSFKQIGFSRLDIRLNNIIITPEKKLRPIDPVSIMRYKISYPKILLTQLKKLGLEKRFLKHVKEIDQKKYKNWKRHFENRK